MSLQITKLDPAVPLEDLKIVLAAPCNNCGGDGGMGEGKKYTCHVCDGAAVRLFEVTKEDFQKLFLTKSED